MIRQAASRASIPLLVLALTVSLAACGGSKSGSENSSGTTRAEDATSSSTTTTLPSASSVSATCGAAVNALQKVGDTISNQGTVIDLTVIKGLISDAVAPVQACQQTMRLAIPGLAPAIQAPATQYADGLNAVLASLQNPPTDAAAVPGWIRQLSTTFEPLAAIQLQLSQADSAFTF